MYSMRLVQVNIEITKVVYVDYHPREMRTTGHPALLGKCPIAQAGDK